MLDDDAQIYYRLNLHGQVSRVYVDRFKIRFFEAGILEFLHVKWCTLFHRPHHYAPFPPGVISRRGAARKYWDVWCARCGDKHESFRLPAHKPRWLQVAAEKLAAKLRQKDEATTWSLRPEDGC